MKNGVCVCNGTLNSQGICFSTIINSLLSLKNISRSLNGKGNNLNQNEWGSANTILQRKSKPFYSDNLKSVDQSRTDPRTISN